MRNAGLPIEVLKDYVRLFLQGDDTIEARKNLFIEQRKYLIEKIENMKKTLERLDYKISVYENIIVEKEKSLRRDSLYTK
jgi:DNA-binding transcriptional MerR regulator